MLSLSMVLKISSVTSDKDVAQLYPVVCIIRQYMLLFFKKHLFAIALFFLKYLYKLVEYWTSLDTLNFGNNVTLAKFLSKGKKRFLTSNHFSSILKFWNLKLLFFIAFIALFFNCS